MSIGAVSSASTPHQIDSYLTSSTAPYQASPTDSTTASSLPLSQAVPGSTDHTFSASTVDHELNAVNTPNPLGTSSGQPIGANAVPDSLAQSGIGLNVSAAQ
jgi:hypothetical protein